MPLRFCISLIAIGQLVKEQLYGHFILLYFCCLNIYMANLLSFWAYLMAIGQNYENLGDIQVNKEKCNGIWSIRNGLKLMVHYTHHISYCVIRIVVYSIPDCDITWLVISVRFFLL